jgi:hypothetical protein
MDDARRSALLAELELAKRERAELDSFITVLSARLGLAVIPESAEQPDPAGATNGGVLTDDVLTLVYENELFGMSIPKAAATVLDRWSPEPHHRPIKTTELVKALAKGGLQVKEARTVYRSLYGTTRFHNLKGGQWGYASWYPASAKAKTDKPADEEDEPAVGAHTSATESPGGDTQDEEAAS